MIALSLLLLLLRGAQLLGIVKLPLHAIIPPLRLDYISPIDQIQEPLHLIHDLALTICLAFAFSLLGLSRLFVMFGQFRDWTQYRLAALPYQPLFPSARSFTWARAQYGANLAPGPPPLWKSLLTLPPLTPPPSCWSSLLSLSCSSPPSTSSHPASSSSYSSSYSGPSAMSPKPKNELGSPLGRSESCSAEQRDNAENRACAAHQFRSVHWPPDGIASCTRSRIEVRFVFPDGLLAAGPPEPGARRLSHSHCSSPTYIRTSRIAVNSSSSSSSRPSSSAASFPFAPCPFCAGGAALAFIAGFLDSST